ncbi:uncharacterized protein [Centroberyx affinis]|uniref:uncharacterized protein n=1 Tax=Centroberyx affinis TaxID=166261 RepID=UPI003A5BD69D
MAEFRRTKITLCLILVFHVTAVTGQRSPSSFYVRDGDEVTLPCENVTPNYDKCDYTAWIFNHFINKDTVELVSDGKIASNEFAKAKAARLSVTADCSLVIKKVTVEDVGFYTCRQFMSGQIRPDAQVYLSLVNTVTEQMDKTNLTLSCSVVKYGDCRASLMWLYEGVKWNRNISNIWISQSTCHTTVSFPSSIYIKERFQCEVTDRSRTVQTFDFTSLSSGTKATTTTKSTIATTAKETGPTTNSKQEVLWFIIGGLAAVLIIVVALIICWKRARGNKTPAEDNTALTVVSDANPAVKQSGPETNQDQTDQDDGLTYASISHSNNNEKEKKKKKKTAGKTQVPNNDGDEEDATVTYATVKTSSASAGDANDPSNLYSTVNMTRK